MVDDTREDQQTDKYFSITWGEEISFPPGLITPAFASSPVKRFLSLFQD